MSCIKLQPYYDMFCMEPVSDYPDDPSKGCIVLLEGHATDQNGYWIYNGNSWIIWIAL